MCLRLAGLDRLIVTSRFTNFTLFTGRGTCRGISVSHRLDRRVFRSPIKFTRRRTLGSLNSQLNLPEVTPNRAEPVVTDDEVDGLIPSPWRAHGSEHQIFIIQPYIKWGRGKNKMTTPQLQLDEAVALVDTLNWKTVDTKLVPLLNFQRSLLFGKGQLQNLRDIFGSNKSVTAVFVNVNMLKPHQQMSLEEIFRVPVFDRYTIVLQIFREHASTRESKLQIELAELPYLQSRLSYMDSDRFSRFGGETSRFGNIWRGKQSYKSMMRERQARIMEELKHLKDHRKLLRKERMRNEIPVVAVVGYTNAGKTSLIKALTDSKKLEPKDCLFATLNVTVHAGILPSSLKVLYLDTIGFISDIPTSLLESFNAALEDVQLADIILHIRDISHPDTSYQNENVIKTLESLNLMEKQRNVITVGNKIDLVGSSELDEYKNEGMVLISASKMIGTDVLKQRIDDMILCVTNRKSMIMKVKSGRDEYLWLHENATVVDEVPFPENNQYILIKVIITSVALDKFKHIFIKNFYATRTKA